MTDGMHDLVPETPWDELIARSKRRGTSIRRWRAARRSSPLAVLAALMMWTIAPLPMDESSFADKNVTTVDDGRQDVVVDADGEIDRMPPRRTGASPSPSPSKPSTATPGEASVAVPTTVVPSTTVQPATGSGRAARVAFVRGDPLLYSGQLMVMNADGSGLRAIVAASGRPSWSPDGTRLMFHRARQDVPSGTIHSIGLDGSDERFLHTGMYPDWSPDGSRMVFSDGERYDGVTFMDLWIANADGSSSRRLMTDPAGEYMPEWSPDGSLIAYLRIEGSYAAAGTAALWVVRADGSGARKLADIGAGAVTAHTWSPDGRNVLYSCGHDDLCIVGVDGGAPRRFGPSGPIIEYGVSWAADGKTIFVQREMDNAYLGEKMSIWALDGEGNNPRRLTTPTDFDDVDPAAWP